MLIWYNESHMIGNTQVEFVGTYDNNIIKIEANISDSGNVVLFEKHINTFTYQNPNIEDIYSKFSSKISMCKSRLHRRLAAENIIGYKKIVEGNNELH